MHVVIVYDVSTERVARVCKSLRRHLTWVQNSVFEGEVTKSARDDWSMCHRVQNSVFEGEVTAARFQEIQADLSAIIEPAQDSVLFYCMHYAHGWEKRVMGRERNSTEPFL